VTIPQIQIKFFAKPHLSAQQKYFWKPYWIPWQPMVENFKNSNLNIIRAFCQTPCDQLFSKTKLTVADAATVLPGQVSSTQKCPLPLSYRAITGASRTPAGGRWKTTTSASLSPDQRARFLAIAEVSERRQHMSGGAASPTTRPLDQTSSTEPPRPDNFPAPATSGNPSSRPRPCL
jgi:hypothetical protein